MPTGSLNYYGYDRNTYRDCLSQIRGMNLKHTFFLNTWSLVMMLVFLAIRIYDNVAMSSVFMRFNMNGLDRVRVGVFVVFTVISIVFEVLIVVFLKHPERNGTIMMYLSTALMIAFSIMISMSQSMKPAILFHVMLVLISVSYIDTMLRMSVGLFIFTGFFLYSVFRVIPIFRHQPKPLSIANEDVFYAVVILVFSLILHYTMQRTRMQQFVTYLNNVKITHDLEVKTNFDALTFLLTRSCFMRMAAEVIRDRSEDEYIAISLINLDGLTQINEKLGHRMGDKVIQLTGQAVVKVLGSNMGTLGEKIWSFPDRALKERYNFACRFAGDELMLMIRGEKDEDAVRGKMEKLLSILNDTEFGELHGIHASFGVTELSKADEEIDEAYGRADDALFYSKHMGKNKITFYEPGIRGKVNG